MTIQELGGDGHVNPIMDDDDMLGEVCVVEAAVRVLGLPHHQGPEHGISPAQTCWEADFLS